MQLTPMIDVADVPASSAWYQRLLGCESGHGGPDFEMLMAGGSLVLMLHRRGAHEHPGSAQEGEPLGRGLTLYVRVEDINAVAARADEMGVKHDGVKWNALAHQDELEVHDPDGYGVTVCGPASWA